jgi:hypothetical protein
MSNQSNVENVIEAVPNYESGPHEHVEQTTIVSLEAD